MFVPQIFCSIQLLYDKQMPLSYVLLKIIFHVDISLYLFVFFVYNLCIPLYFIYLFIY